MNAEYATHFLLYPEDYKAITEEYAKENPV
jgi:hypothetical protein